MASIPVLIEPKLGSLPEARSLRVFLVMLRYLTFIFRTKERFLNSQVIEKYLCIGKSHWKLEKGWEVGDPKAETDARSPLP